MRAHTFAGPGPAGTPRPTGRPQPLHSRFDSASNRISEDCAGRLDVLANRNLDQAVTDAAHAASHPRAGGLDLDRLRFGHQDGARSLVSSHVNPDSSVLVDQVPAPAP